MILIGICTVKYCTLFCFFCYWEVLYFVLHLISPLHTLAFKLFLVHCTIYIYTIYISHKLGPKSPKMILSMIQISNFQYCLLYRLYYRDSFVAHRSYMASGSINVTCIPPQGRDQYATATRFTKDFYPQFKFDGKFGLAVITLLAIRLQQFFAHVTTAQLSCHAQNFVAIIVLESMWEWNELSMEFELRWKSVSETGPKNMTRLARTDTVWHWDG